MKYFSFFSPFILLLIFTGLASAEPNQVKKIQLEGGKPTTLVKGTVQSGREDKYLLEVDKGKKVQIRLQSHNKKAMMEIYDKSGVLVNEGSLPDEFEGSFALPEHLEISVSSGKPDTQYTLEVTVQNIR